MLSTIYQLMLSTISLCYLLSAYVIYYLSAYVIYYLSAYVIMHIRNIPSSNMFSIKIIKGDPHIINVLNNVMVL